MNNELKYMIITVESFPTGFDTFYFYLPVISNIKIGDVLTSTSGKKYKIIDGKTQVPFDEIDLTLYKLFEWLHIYVALILILNK